MRNVDGSYRTGAEKKIRDVGVKILTNDDEAKTINSDRILSISIQRSISGGSFSIGNAPSDRLNAVIVGTEKLPKKTRITVYVNFDGSDWERLGRFYVDSCTRNGQRITVTAYDALSLAEKPVKFGGKSDKDLEKLDFPCTMQEMLDYVVTLRGMTCNFECQPFTVQKKPMKSETEYYTARELFGLIAACHGCNAKMDSDGKLTFREFGAVNATFTAGNVLDQMIDDSEPFTVQGVLLQKDENTAFYIDDVPGSEYDEDADGIVICNNPLATVEIAEYVWNRIGKLSYYGGSLKIRGAGILECGDVVSIANLKCPTDTESYAFCITDIAYSISREDGFLETLSSEVSRKASSGGTASSGASGNNSPLKDINISTGKIEYNGEVYRLQRGNDRKVIAVSQGKKCTRIYATTESESEAAAVSAVIHGLDEPWDIEYDYFVSGDGYGVTPFFAGDTQLRFSIPYDPAIDNSAITEVDYGDGSETVTTYSGESHTIEHKGYYHMRIKTTATKLAQFGGDDRYNWDSGKEIDPEKWREGQHVYIGGNIRSVERIYGKAISHLTWGESVAFIDNSTEVGSDSPLGFIDVGLPPFFISSFEQFEIAPEGSHQILYESPVNYLYIPESCRRVFHIGFGGLPLKTLEIEPAGESLTFDSGAFLQYNNSPFKVLSVPARVKFRGSYSPFDGAGIRVLYLQRGIQEIVSYSFIGCYSSGFSIGNSVVIGKNGDVFIFIPKTVTSIRYFSFSFSSGSVINVVYEGNQTEWNGITKEKWWIRDREEPDNIAFGETYYNSFETLVDNLRDKYLSGVGIEVSDMISLKPATKDTLGGVKAGESRSGIKNSYGKLSLEKADLSTFGGLQLGKGLYPSPNDSHGYGIVDVFLGKGLIFVEQESEKDTNEGSTEENESSTEESDSQENNLAKKMSAIEVNFGDGLRLDPSGDEEEPDYGKIHLNLGNGLEFGERNYEKKKDSNGNDTEENDPTRYTSKVEVKIGAGMRFGENGELIAEGGAYTAGENITISEDGKISADVKEYTAGENITISEDGEISATGEGITIDQAVIIKEADAKYLLHDFTEIEYNSGMQIGYAGPGNQIVIQGYIAYPYAVLNEGTNNSSASKWYYPENGVPNFSRYSEISADFYSNTAQTAFKKSYLKQTATTPNAGTYSWILTRTDDADVTQATGIVNSNHWSGIGLLLEWLDIYPPGYTSGSKVFENGCANIRFHYIRKSNTSVANNQIYERTRVNTNYLFPFASLAEYQAAVGLTYEPLTLTQVEDNPTVVSGKDI